MTITRSKTVQGESALDRIERLARLIESGDVVPAVGRRFELAETADAIRALEAGELTWKAVVVVGGVDGGS